MKRTLLISILILVATVTLVASTSSSSSLNFLSKLYADTLYQPIVYGEIYNKTSSGFTFTPAVSEVYYNLTGLVCGNIYGFDCTETTQALGGTYLTAQKDGLYTIQASLSGDGVTNSLYGVAIGLDFTRQANCYSQVDGTGKVDVISISCLLDVKEGQTINILAEDEANPPQAFSLHAANLNIVAVKP